MEKGRECTWSKEGDADGARKEVHIEQGRCVHGAGKKVYMELGRECTWSKEGDADGEGKGVHKEQRRGCRWSREVSAN